MARFYKQFLYLGVEKPRIALLLILITVALAAIGLKNLKIKSDHRVYFDKDNISLQNYEQLKDTYSGDDTLMIGIEASEGELLTPQNIKAIQKLTQAMWKLPYVTRVDSLSNFQRIYAAGDEEVIIEDYIPKEKKLSSQDIISIRSLIAKDDDLVGRLINPSMDFTVVIANLDIITNYDSAVPNAAQATRKLIAKFEANFPNLRFLESGGIMLNNAFAEASQSDIKSLIPIMYLVVTILTYFILRSLLGVCLVLLIVSLATIVGMGVLGWLGIPLSPPSAIAPIVIMTVSIADAVHIFTDYTQRLRNSKSSHFITLTKTIEELLMPLFVTSFTTAIGFLALNFSDSPPFRHLGTASAVGVVFAFISSIWALPAIIILFKKTAPRLPILKENMFECISHFNAVNSKIIIVSFIILTLLAIFNIFHLKIDSNAFRYFDESYRFRVDTDHLVEKLGGLERIEYSFVTGEEGGVFEPDFLKKIERFTEYSRQLSGVTYTSSSTNIFKKLNQAMQGGQPEFYKIPESYELAAQYLTFYEMSLPFGQGITNQIDIDKSSLRVTLGLGDITTTKFLNISQQVDTWLRSNEPSLKFLGPSGISTMFTDITYSNIMSNLKGGLLAYALITLVLIFALGSLKYGLLSLIPNLLPCLFALGTWRIFHDTIGLPGTIVFTLTIGIIVDDTVHYLARYVRQRKQGETREEAADQALIHVGPALTSTSIILCAGFAVLSLSSFTGNSHVGTMSFLCIAYALFADLILLPSALRLFRL